MESLENPGKKMGYRPTLESMGETPSREMENEHYMLPQYPYVTRIPTPSETKKAFGNVRSFGLNAAQAFGNTPEQIANVFGGHLYNKFNFAPHDQAGKAGEITGDIASYFLPGGALSGSARALSYVPKVNELLKLGSEALKSKPITNFIANLGRHAGEAALFQKAKNPESTPVDVAKASGIGGTLALVSNALTNQNPFIRTAAKLGAGGLLGYQFNGIPGALEGAGAAMVGPKLMREIGLMKKPISTEMLTAEPTQEAHQKYLASQRLGDTGTPAEVFNSPLMGARQGEISRSEAGANAMTQFGEQRIKQQQNAINNLLEKIFPNTKKANNEIRNLYDTAYKHNITQNTLHDLIEDPIIARASKTVFEDPVYAKDLKNVNSDSYAYLDQVKRSIDDMEQSALRSGEKNKARIYRDSAKKLTDVMDKEAPEYKLARDAAQRKIIHSEITKRLNKKPISGKNFYREFLSNENKFNEFKGDVKNIKGAGEILDDMKLSWNNLIGYDTPATAAGMTAKHTNTAREGFQKFWNEFKDMFGAPRDIERANFIRDPNWWNKFDEVMKNRKLAERNRMLSDLVSSGITASTLEGARQKQKK